MSAKVTPKVSGEQHDVRLGYRITSVFCDNVRGTVCTCSRVVQHVSCCISIYTICLGLAVSVAIVTRVQQRSSMHCVVNGHSNRLMDGNRNLLDNRHINRVGLLDWYGIGPVHRDDVGLRHLDLNRDVVRFLNDVRLGNVHDVRTRNLDLMRHSVGPLHFDSIGHRNILGYRHVLVNWNILLNDLRHRDWLGNRHALVHRYRLVDRYGVRRGHRVRYRHGPGDLVHNDRSRRRVRVSMTSVISSVSAVSAISIVAGGRSQPDKSSSHKYGD